MMHGSTNIKFANFHIPGLLESSLSCDDGYPNAGLSRLFCRFM